MNIRIFLPEDGHKRIINGTTVIDVQVIPAAFCGEVVEAKSNCRVLRTFY